MYNMESVDLVRQSFTYICPLSCTPLVGEDYEEIDRNLTVTDKCIDEDRVCLIRVPVRLFDNLYTEADKTFTLTVTFEPKGVETHSEITIKDDDGRMSHHIMCNIVPWPPPVSGWRPGSEDNIVTLWGQALVRMVNVKGTVLFDI